MIKVIGLGDNVVDYYLHTQTVYPGGNALNFSVYSKMMGFQSAYMGIFGDDENAEHVYQTIQDLNIETKHCRFYSGENGCAPVNIVDGDRVFLGSNKGGISKEHPWELTTLDLKYLQQFDLIHTSIFSYIDSQLPTMAAHGLRVSYDFSNRFSEEFLFSLCPYLWCACLSSSERNYEDNIALIHQAVAHGCPNVILTRGTDGALVYFNGKLYEQSPCLVCPVDTMGAGDSFITAFLTSYLHDTTMCCDFPMIENMHGLVTNQEATEAAVRLALHKAAVFSSKTCQQDGSFGFGMHKC